jgi:hypothetical protein
MPPEKVEEVRLREETLDHLKAVMRDAVREGVRDLVTEETIAAFWSGGLTMLQQQAAQHAGRFVLGGLWGLFRKASLFLLLGGAVYALGGWTALAALAKALFSQGGST